VGFTSTSTTAVPATTSIKVVATTDQASGKLKVCGSTPAFDGQVFTRYVRWVAPGSPWHKVQVDRFKCTPHVAVKFNGESSCKNGGICYSLSFTILANANPVHKQEYTLNGVTTAVPAGQQVTFDVPKTGNTTLTVASYGYDNQWTTDKVLPW
jgi:hypothetical protein